MKKNKFYLGCVTRSVSLMLIVIVQSVSAIEIVSLGDGCMTARAARYNSLRDTAYPFDWMITSMQSLMNAFGDDFKQVLVPGQTFERDDNKAVIDGYGLVFIHDFATVKNSQTPIDGEIMPVHSLVSNWRDSIDIVSAKFNRRLQKLLTLLQLGHPVALIRYGDINRDQAELFISLLKQKFPQAKAVLVVVGTTSEFKESWCLDHVRTMYIPENDFRSWDGPVWSDTMFKIAAMNPQGWSSDIDIPHNYILTAPVYNPGLFSVFNTVLGALDSYDRGYISGLSIDFEKNGWYFDENYGSNWWNYYFEPIELGSNDGGSVVKKLFPTYQKIIFAYQSQFEMPRERAYELIQKYIHVRSHILKQIDDFCFQWFDDKFVIGVHYRGTDKLTEASPISRADIVARINDCLAQHQDQAVKIFVATDDASFCGFIKEQFSDLIVMRDALRSDNDMGVHTRSDLAPYQKGEDAIIDCLLLSRCDVLIKMASNLSDSSLCFNPGISVVRLNASYSE